MFGGKPSNSFWTYASIERMQYTVLHQSRVIPEEQVQYHSEPITMWFDRRLVLRQSPIQGIGTFATEPIPAGQLLIMVAGGLVFTSADWQTGRVHVEAELYNQESLAADVYIITPKLFHYYLNHRCEPNAVDLSRSANATQYVAWREIEAGEEITTDYGIAGGATIAQCACQTPRCRGHVTPDDWRLPELQERYCGYFPWRLERQRQQSNTDE